MSQSNQTKNRSPLARDMSDDGPVPEYVQGLAAADTKAALLKHLARFRDLAKDALQIAKAIKADDWQEFRRGLLSERSGDFAGEAWATRYGAVLMPLRMFRASMVAHEFVVPWWVAYDRLVQLGEFKEET